MGCQTSRLDHGKEEMLPNLPPILSRKLEEIRSRRARASNLSKKKLFNKDGSDRDDSGAGSKRELLNKDGSNHDDSASGHSNDQSNESSPEHDNDHNIVGSAEVVPEAEAEAEPTKPKEYNNKKDKEDKEDEHNIDECESLSRIEGSLTCPGSPSFRFYLTDDESVIHHKQEDDHTLKDDYMNKGSLSDTEVDAAEIVDSQTPITESATAIKKTGRKGMKFRRVIPMGRPVKNFLNVACYYPTCGGNEIARRRLLQAKSTTM